MVDAAFSAIPVVETAPCLQRPRRAEVLAVTALAIVALAQGFFAVKLNQLYYAKHAPFFDSMAYDCILARVLTASSEHGIAAGLHEAIFDSTVALPYLLAALAGPWASVSRATGVWLQIPWVFALLLSCYAVFRLRFRASPWTAFFLALPFTSISAIYFVDGGLSDFRMDLQNYLLYGCAVCWFVIALQTRSFAHWIVCGVFIGLAALARATAPVFLVLTFGPILMLRLGLDAGKWKKLLLGASVAFVVAALVAGWFFLLRYRYLYYYYVVWNTDANAHLPLRTSVAHFRYAWESVGGWIVISSVAAVAVTISWRSPSRARIKKWLSTFPWEFALAALVPAGFLVVRGAGKNPFVSMPSAFGLVGLILAARGDWSDVGRFRGGLAAAILIVACAINAHSGYDILSPSQTRDQVAGYNTALEYLQADSRKRGLATAEFTTMSVSNSFCTDALFNILVFDKGYSHVVGMAASNRELTIDADHAAQFTAATYWDWLTIPGATDAERIDHLVKTANSSIDYIFIPSDATLTWLETQRSSYYINHYSRWLAHEILANPAWSPISRQIPINASETFTIYANRSRSPK